MYLLYTILQIGSLSSLPISKAEVGLQDPLNPATPAYLRQYPLGWTTPTNRLLKCSTPDACDYDERSNACAPGCLWPDLKKNICDKSCDGECFAYCDFGTYCSAGCKFDDLNQGICYDYCSHECLESCKIKCPDHCLEFYRTNNFCPEECNEVCCRSNTNASSNDYDGLKYLGIILGSIFGVIVLSIVILSIIKYRKRSNDSRKKANSVTGILPSSSTRFNAVLEKFRLSTLQYNESIHIAGERVCTIDLTEFFKDDLIVITECEHAFHAGCLSEWLDRNVKEKKCPNCNHSFIINEINTCR